MASTTRAPGAVSRRIDSPRPAQTLAPMSLRVAGAVIDLVLLLVVVGLATAWISQRVTGVVQVRVAESGATSVIAPAVVPTWTGLMLWIAVSAIYTVPLMAIWGRTVGGWCVGIRALRIANGRPLGWSSSARRWLLIYGIAGLASLLPRVGGVAWLLILVVGLSPLWDSTRRLRGYADHWAGDVVVRAPWHH